jgi:hypothetical protein
VCGTGTEVASSKIYAFYKGANHQKWNLIGLKYWYGTGKYGKIFMKRICVLAE